MNTISKILAILLLLVYGNLSTHCFGQSKGKFLYPIKDHYKWGIINEKGIQVVPPEFDRVDALYNHEYALIVKNGKFGLYHYDGNQVLEAKYDEIKIITSGLIAFRSGLLWGLSNNERPLFEPSLQDVYPLNSRFFAIKQEGKFGFTDSLGSIVLVPDLDTLFHPDGSQPNRSDFFIGKDGGSIILLNSKAELMTDGPIQEYTLFPNGYLGVKFSDKWGVLSPSSQWIMPFEQEALAFVMPAFIASKQKKWSVYSALTEKTIVGNEFDFFQTLDDYYALGGWYLKARKDKIWGVIDEHGKTIIPFSYESIQSMGNGFVAASQNGQWAILKGKGSAVFPPSFKTIYKFQDEFDYTKVVLKDKEGLLAKDGTLAIPCEYDIIDVFSAYVLAYKGDKVDVFPVSKEGILGKKSSYNHMNEVSLDPYSLGTRKYFSLASLEDNSGLRWWKNNRNQWFLVNEGQKSVLKDSYDLIQVDPVAKLSLGCKTKETGLNTRCDIIDHTSGKLLFSLKAGWIELSDFRDLEVARVARDSMCLNALVLKDGSIKSKILKEGKEVTIDSLGSFSNGIVWCRAGNTYGYLDDKGNTIFPAELQEAGDFSSGIARVKYKNSYGYINLKGEWVLPTEFNEVSPLINGYIVGIKNNLYGLFDANGKSVLPLEFQKISFVKNGVLRAKKNGKWGVVTTQGKAVLPFEYDEINEFIDGYASVKKSGLMGMVKDNGSVVISPSLQVHYLEYKGKDLVFVGIKPQVDPQDPMQRVLFQSMGYVKTDGSELVPTHYTHIEGFEDVYFSGKGLSKVLNGQKIGYIDAKGKIVLPAKYDKIEGDFEKIFEEKKGVVLVQVGNSWGFVSFEGKEFVPPRYEKIIGYESLFENKGNGMAVVKYRSKYGAIDVNGELIIDASYDFGGMAPNQNEYAVFVTQGKWGLMGVDKKWILPQEYDQIRYLEKEGVSLLELFKKLKKFEFINKEEKVAFSIIAEDAGMLINNLIPVKKDGKWGLMSQEKKWLVNPIYDSLISGKQYFPFLKAGKWGAIDASGKELFSGKADELHAFVSDKAAAKSNGKWGILDAKGNWVVAAMYHSCRIEGPNGILVAELKEGKNSVYSLFNTSGKPLTKDTYSEVLPFSEGLLGVKLINKSSDKARFGYLDEKGELVIPHNFPIANPFYDGLARIKIPGNRSFGYINKTGAVVIPPKYEDATDFGDGLACGGGIIFNTKGVEVAKLPANTRPISRFKDGALCVLDKTQGYYHLSTSGIPLYSARMDSVFDYSNEYAFVKSSEVWNLIRETSFGDKNKVKFSKPGMLKYIYEHPNMNKPVIDKFKEGFIDRGWEKVKDGVYKIIDKEGHLINYVMFTNVDFSNETYIKVEIEGLYGVADTKGKILAAPTYEVRKYYEGGIIRLESSDKIGYLDINGTWIWSPHK